MRTALYLFLFILSTQTACTRYLYINEVRPEPISFKEPRWPLHNPVKIYLNDAMYVLGYHTQVTQTAVRYRPTAHADTIMFLHLERVHKIKMYYRGEGGLTGASIGTALGVLAYSAGLSAYVGFIPTFAAFSTVGFITGAAVGIRIDTVFMRSREQHMLEPVKWYHWSGGPRKKSEDG